MKPRRALLATGLGLLCLTGAHRVRATTHAEIEAAGYGGESSGGWICGPTGRVAYGGLGVQAKISTRERHDEEGEGTVVILGASGERQTTTVRCSSECSADRGVTPPPHAMLGGHARAGYRWRYFGLEGGAGVYQGWDENTDHAPSVAAYPELEFRGGKSGDLAVQGVLGFGSPVVTTIQRPGLYGGVTVDKKDLLGVDFRTGIFRQGPAVLDSAGWRADLVGRVTLVPSLELRGGGAVGFHENDDAPDVEGSAGLAVSF